MNELEVFCGTAHECCPTNFVHDCHLDASRVDTTQRIETLIRRAIAFEEWFHVEFSLHGATAYYTRTSLFYNRT